jgi:nitrite reductase (NADH) small subunit/3-phenylpropionate/trans-cinnamate dioxygenase ferredoxin subunit
VVTEAQQAGVFKRVAGVDELKESRGHAVYLDGTRVAVFRRGNRFWAVADSCPHMGASLSEGQLSRRGVRCQWHGWQFDLETGQCRQKSWARVQLYETKVEDGSLLLRPVPLPEREEEPGEEPWLSWEPPTDAPAER